jgi:hypothetical protein
MSQFTIICVTDEEPECFHPDASRGFAVRLSVRSGADNESDAQKDIESFLNSVQDIRFSAYRYEASTLIRTVPVLEPVARTVAPAGLMADFQAWLRERADKQTTLPGASGYFYRAAPPPQPGVTVTMTEKTLDAEHMLRAASSWTAPAAQQLQLAFTLRLPADQQGLVVFLPYFDDSPPVETYAVTEAKPGESVTLEEYVPTDKRWSCITNLTKPPVLDSTEIDPESGFLKITPGTEEGHRTLKRVEERAGSLFTGFFCVREMCTQVLWPQRGKDEVNDEAQLRTAELRAAHMLAWGAVASMASALDIILLAARMPARDRRDGALMAPLLDILEERLADRAPVSPARKTVRAALRSALGKAMPPVPADAAQRRNLVNRLKLVCCIGSNGNWFDALLDAYVEQGDAQWTRVIETARTLVADHRGASHQRAAAEALDQALAVLQNNVTSEFGVERTTLALLLMGEVSAQWVAEMGKESSIPASALAAVYSEAVAAYGQRFENDINANEAARHAVGSLLADLLPLESSDKAARAGPEQLKQAFAGWRFWQRRLALETDSVQGAIHELLSALAHPVSDLKAFIGAPMPAFDNAAAMQNSVEDDLFPSARLRFLPDHAPAPIAVRLCIDPAADDDDDGVDDFSTAMAGVALLVRRSNGAGNISPWAHANLAQLTAGEDRRLAPFGIQALPTTIVDGRRNMFVTFDGLPIATSAFDDALSGATGLAWERFLASDYPVEHPDFASLAPLAYGTQIDIAAHVVGRAGSLPEPLQRGAPWSPNPTVAFDETRGEHHLVTSLPYARRTAVGRTIIASERGGGVPAGVKPLAIDYPRVGLASGRSQFLDLHRNSDGSGAIAVPTVLGSITRVVLSALRYAGGTPAGVLRLGVCNTPALADGLPDWVDLDLLAGEAIDLTVTLTCTQGAGDNAALTLELHAQAGGQSTHTLITLDQADPLWIRLQLDAGVNAAVSLTDPNEETARRDATARPVPDNLVLLGAPLAKRGKLWRAPFDQEQLPGHVEWPRVGYLDFMRWHANEALRPALYGDMSADDVAAFEVLLVAAYIGRTEDAELAKMLERLPDPGVSAMRIDLFATDSLCTRTALPQPTSVIVTAPKLGAILKQSMGKVKSFHVKVVLRAIDEYFRHQLVLVAADQDVAGKLSLSEAGHTLTATIAAGTVARLSARPLVARTLFTGNTPVFDQRLLQWAVGFDEQAAQVCFEGASLQVETMIGPLASVKDRDWRLDRQAWSELVQSELIQHQGAGLARQYYIRAVPGAEHWQWRQLAEIDVATQRWRFSGHPIYSWFSPRASARAETRDRASLELRHSALLQAFEDEAFNERDPHDAEVETARLLPVPAVTTLATVVWEQPGATMFRHRFILRSRYAGAMRAEADSQCEAWAENAVPNAEHAWRRVVMLADRSHLLLTRPQMRALLPLTVSPETAPGVTPPTMCVLQEPPFCNGGLAARVCAEIRTGIGYEFRQITVPGEDGGASTTKTVAMPRDARKELGPDPRLSYLPYSAARARRVVLSAEGPIGLGFDRDIGQGGAFPNTALMLTPEIPGSGEPEVLALDEHFLGVGLLRYLDPEWLVDDASDPVARDDAHIRARFGTPWWIQFPQREGAMHVGAVNGDTGMVIAAWKRQDGVLQAMMRVRAIDDSVESESDNIELCSIAEDAAGEGSLVFLHTPLDDRRARLSVFFRPKVTQTMRRAAGNAPVLLGSMEWSVPKGQNASALIIDGADASVHAVNASASTALQWTRTGRNFDTVLCQRGPDPTQAAPAGVADLMAMRHGAEVELYATKAPEDAVWVRPFQGTQPFAVHAQRHLAVLPSNLRSTVGMPIDVPMAAHMAPARIIALSGSENVDRLRLIEFETPAIIIGRLANGAELPPQHGRGYLDLHASGFDRLVPIGSTGLDLSLFARLVAGSETLRTLSAIELALETHSGKEVLLVLRRDAGSAAHAFSIDIGVSTTGSASNCICCAIDATGQTEVHAGVFVDQGTGKATEAWQILPLPASVASQSAHGLGIRVTSATFSDGLQHELWLEISMLVSATGGRRKGFTHEVDFDWFFGNSIAGVNEAISVDGLANMREAQGRIISVSQPVKVSAI